MRRFGGVVAVAAAIATFQTSPRCCMPVSCPSEDLGGRRNASKLGSPPVADSCSDRVPVAAQPDRSGEEYRGDREADPQTGAAQERTGSEVHQRIHRETAG